MAKKPTPKKQQSNSSSSRRYKSYQNKARKRLLNTTSISNCPKCKEDKLSHTACPTCGHYNGRNVIDKEKQLNKITKIKA